MLKYNISYNNLHIYDSCDVKKSKFERELCKIKNMGYETCVFERSMFSLKMEWATHNFLYMLGIARDRTRDCDLDNPCDKPEWLYCILGIVSWIFIA